MRHIIASIFLIALLGQTFNQGLYFLDYMIQKEAYMKRCVNKARPAMHCNGKCQLMKRLQEEEKKQQGQAPELKKGGNLETLFARSILPAPRFTLPLIIKHPIPAHSGMAIDRCVDIFHPPPASC